MSSASMVGVSVLNINQSYVLRVGLMVWSLQASIRHILDIVLFAIVVLRRLCFLAPLISVNYSFHGNIGEETHCKCTAVPEKRRLYLFGVKVDH